MITSPELIRGSPGFAHGSWLGNYRVAEKAEPGIHKLPWTGSRASKAFKEMLWGVARLAAARRGIDRADDFRAWYRFCRDTIAAWRGRAVYDPRVVEDAPKIARVIERLRKQALDLLKKLLKINSRDLYYGNPVDADETAFDVWLLRAMRCELVRDNIWRVTGKSLTAASEFVVVFRQGVM